MLSAGVEMAMWSTGQWINHHTGWINETAGRIKWNTVNKGEIPILFVHWSPANQDLPVCRLPSRWRWNSLPFSGRVWAASGGSGWCSLGSPSLKWVACPLQASKGARTSHCSWRSALGNTHSSQHDEEDQSLEWGEKKKKTAWKKWNCHLWHTHCPGELSEVHSVLDLLSCNL